METVLGLGPGPESRITNVLRRPVAGVVWCALWIVVLYGFAEPWQHLGGIVSERLRWWVRLAIGTGLVVGTTLGGQGRHAVASGMLRSHAELLRYALAPPAAISTALLTALRIAGQRDPIAVVTLAFLSYWAGLDLGFGAVPLLRGRAYRFNGPLPAEPENEGETLHERE